jgi:RNA-directed DNA polymerase
MTYNDKTVGSDNQAFKRLEPCARKPACTVPRGASGGNITGLLDFDNLDHDLVMKAVKHHTQEKWIHLYIKRWLEAPLQLENGEIVERRRGTPQGGVISPLLANLFMHHAFDDWMKRQCPEVKFERFADDIVAHCSSEKQAEKVLEKIRNRLKKCGLELHPEKTKIVYCKDDYRRGFHENESFDFLGYTFRP